MDNTWVKNSQKPRERLLYKGTAHLSDHELLTILLSSGSSKLSCASIALALLEKADRNLKTLFLAPPDWVQEVAGIGLAKYCTINAGMELGRRMSLRPIEAAPSISNANQAYAILREHIAHCPQETIFALFLDNRNHILCHEEVSAKSFPSGSELDLRKLLKTALNRNAASIILAHNHPSGETSPSREDVAMSIDLSSLLASMGIELLDHLIITEQGFTRIEWKPTG